MYKSKKLGKVRRLVEVASILLAILALSLLEVEAATIAEFFIGGNKLFTIMFVFWLTASFFLRVLKATQATYAYMWEMNRLLRIIATVTYGTMSFGMTFTIGLILLKFSSPSGELVTVANAIVAVWYLSWIALDFLAVYNEDIYYADIKR